MLNIKNKTEYKLLSGFTLIEVLIGTFLIIIVFWGIFGAYQLGLKVVGLSKNKIIATAIANQQLEKIRNLPYLSVGTLGATLPFVQGVLESATATTRNGMEFTVETKVKYISDEADGIGAGDTCNYDYKRAEISVSWAGQFAGEIKLITDIAPKDKIEEIAACTAQPGGILSVSVFDAYGAMVSSPLIEIFDPITKNLVSFYSPTSGKYDFILTTSTYKVVVSKTGFNTAGTYGADEAATPENMCHARPHQIVLEGQSTPVSFCIDETSVFSVDTISAWGSDYWADSFNNTSKISTSSGVFVSGGKVELATDTEGYLASGSLISVNVNPANLIKWDKFSFSDSKPINTEATYQIYYASGTEWFLIPDSALTGNSIGFDNSPVNLSGLATTTYSQLKLKGNFSTNFATSTPVLFDWQASWIASSLTAVPNALFQIQGEKIIGLDASSTPIYKYFAATTTDSNGHKNISNLEWDNYTFSLPLGSSLDMVNTDPSPQPISLPPDNFTRAVKLYLEADNSLLVTVQDSETLEPVFAATTTLSNIGLGYSQTQYTNNQGQSYFIPLTSSANYILTVEASGYDATSSAISIFGDVTKTIKLLRYD